jgi:hypothetical protein
MGSDIESVQWVTEIDFFRDFGMGSGALIWPVVAFNYVMEFAMSFFE